MARAPRQDGPGVWHHVMNRGIARRTVFEDDRDVRYFLSRLARAVRGGCIEVHAFCVLTTHFHLLVRSKEVGLSHAMHRVLNEYVRWFNRGRKRDGPLFRSRFRSRPVDSLEYRRLLVRYIDDNPVLARLVPTPALYPHGSAKLYARARGPLWLERSWIESEVRATVGSGAYDPARYAYCFGGCASHSLASVIERRIDSRARGSDPLDDLLGATPERVLEWMRDKALLADGSRIDLPVCDAADVVGILHEEREKRPDWPVRLSRIRTCGWRVVEVALLRDLCACTWTEIGERIATAEQGALRAHRIHVRALDEVPEYESTLARVAARAIQRCYGARGTVGLAMK